MEAIYLYFCSKLREVCDLFEEKKKTVVLTFQPKDNFLTKWVFDVEPVMKKCYLEEDGISYSNCLPWNGTEYNLEEDSIANELPPTSFLYKLVYEAEPIVEISNGEGGYSLRDAFSDAYPLYRQATKEIRQSLDEEAANHAINQMDLSLCLTPLIAVLVFLCFVLAGKLVLR